jgi:hypothetical protein
VKLANLVGKLPRSWEPALGHGGGLDHRNSGRQNGTGLHPPNWVALTEKMSREPRSVEFTDLRHLLWDVQIGHRFRFGRLRAGELRITNMVILDRARGAGVGMTRTDTVSVLADVEAGDRARRAKEKGKGGVNPQPLQFEKRLRPSE